MHDPVSTKIKENMACRLMGEISSTDKTWTSWVEKYKNCKEEQKM